MPNRLEIARIAARAAGATLAEKHSSIGEVRSKSSATDFVSDADIAAGISAASAILELNPGARIVVEEPEVCEILGIEPGDVDDERVWIIDPLDGTTSYLHGFPCYSVSIAYAEEGEPVVGAVFNAALGELVSAAKGCGATLNDRAIHCASAQAVSDGLMVTGFPYDRGEPLTRQLAVLAAFLRAPVHGIRRDGSAAVDLCHVAIGRADGFWEFGLKPWDMAAGALICREAGAAVTDAAGAPWTLHAPDIVAANPTLQPQMLEVISAAIESV